jgi:cytochrome c-type biogenesis protein CcmH
MKRTVFALLVFVFASAPLAAVEPDEILKDPAQESRARQISGELRCVVCQNQSIDDSNAPLARDLRVLVRDRIKAGDTNAQVMDYVVARYGPFVLLRPPFMLSTLILWLAPAAIIALAGFFLYRQSRARPATPAATALSTDERRRLGEILKSPER